MYRVEDNRQGIVYQVFVYQDPRKSGCEGRDVEDGVSLDYDMEAVHSWPDGQEAPEECLGRATDDPKHYKVFRNCGELKSARYEPVEGDVLVFGLWKDYLKLLRAEDLEDEDWYRQLDRYDEAARLRRQRGEEPVPPSGGNREEVATWVAKRHLIADSSIREVWYLPHGAPPDEIRLLELNDRLGGNGTTTEAIDFGLDIDGAQFKLLVADISSEQLDQIQRDPSHLPPGWSLQESQSWRRGA